MGTAFILYNHPLFARGLEQLLRRDTGGEVVGVAERSEEALEQIKALQPDVVLIETGKDEFESASVLLRLLREQSLARVAEVSMDNGTFTLYGGRRWQESEAKDLMEAIFDPMAFRIEEFPESLFDSEMKTEEAKK